MTRMRKPFVMFCLWASICAQAQTIWFNVLGDPSDPTVNTIEVDPTPVSINGDTRIMRVRVSRSAGRVSWDGVPYRSYVSEVFFDCRSNTARYITIDFYKLPAWKGQPHQHTVYSQSQPRLMEFRDVEPNPGQRIIRAACQTASITTN